MTVVRVGHDSRPPPTRNRESAIIPVLLGGGIPLLPSPADRATLKLLSHEVYEKTGTVGLEYEVAHAR